MISGKPSRYHKHILIASIVSFCVSATIWTLNELEIRQRKQRALYYWNASSARTILRDSQAMPPLPQAPPPVTATNEINEGETDTVSVKDRPVVEVAVAPVVIDSELIEKAAVSQEEKDALQAFKGMTIDEALVKLDDMLADFDAVQQSFHERYRDVELKHYEMELKNEELNRRSERLREDLESN